MLQIRCALRLSTGLNTSPTQLGAPYALTMGPVHCRLSDVRQFTTKLCDFGLVKFRQEVRASSCQASAPVFGRARLC